MACLQVEGEEDLNMHNRLEIKIRTSEGQYGNILLLVFSKQCSTCQNIEVPLKPLNLHEKILEIDEETRTELYLNEIKI